MDKKVSRKRRAIRTRMKIRQLGINRLSVHRTPRHIYAQLFTADGAQVLACASSVDKEVIAAGGKGGNKTAAAIVGKFIAQRALEKGIKQVAFERSGFNYHGRVKALADAARENGLEF